MDIPAAPNISILTLHTPLILTVRTKKIKKKTNLRKVFQLKQLSIKFHFLLCHSKAYSETYQLTFNHQNLNKISFESNPSEFLLMVSYVKEYYRE